jgi:glycosyltransferase involved in cell wall biosynthesis
MTPAIVAREPRQVTPPARTAGGPLRVMQVVLSLAPGGTERLVIDIVRFLKQESVESVVCCLDDEGAWAEEARALGAPVVALQRGLGFRPGVGRSLAQLASHYAVDVIHCHHYSSFVYGQIGALLSAGPAVVFTEHGRLSDAPPSRKRRAINPLLGRLPAAIFAVSADLRLHMIAEGFHESRVQVLHNGIEPGPMVNATAGRTARAALGLSNDELIVGTVGRLDPVKSFETLIQSLAIVRSEFHDARLVIVGDGAERASLEAEARRLQVDPAVIFAGHRQDVRALLPAFDIFANSSTHEGVSLTILEAMAASVPVVATRVGGTPEVVTPGTGILVAPRSADQLAAALAELARDGDRRARIGEAARARVEASFTAKRMLTAYLASYREHAR